MFVAAGVLIPYMFHIIGGSTMGKVFLPMHIPVLVGAILLGSFYGVLIGSLSVVIGFLIGMPSMPLAFFMFFVLITYGFVAGYLGYKLKINIYLTLIIAMVCGRLASFLLMVCSIHIFSLSLPMQFGTWSYITTGLPGVVIQILLIPYLVQQLKKIIKDEN